MSKYTPTGIPGLTARSGKLYLRFSIPNPDPLASPKKKTVWVEEPTDYVVGQEHLALKALEQVKRALAAGAELKPGKVGPVTVGDFVEEKFYPDRHKTVEDWKSDETRLSRLLKFKLGSGLRIWDMPIRDVHAGHLSDAFLMLREMRQENGEPYAPKTIWNTYGVVRALFREARKHRHVFEDPCVLDDKELGPNVDADQDWRIDAYFERDECELLLWSPLIPPDRRVWYALEYLAATRLGEAAALIWEDWRTTGRQSEPLAGLNISKSHNKPYTKTKLPRMMPVHPTLAAILSDWKLKGWPEMMGRFPRPDDLIVPTSRPEPGKGYRLPLGVMRTEKYVSSRTMKDLLTLGLRHRRGHDLRASFITWAVVDKASETALNACTHTPKSQRAFDKYNRIPWAARCEAVSSLKVKAHAPARGELIPLKAVAGENPLSESSVVTPPLPNGANMRIVGRKQVEAAGIEPVSRGEVEGGRKRSKSVDACSVAGMANADGGSGASKTAERGVAVNGVTAALDRARDGWVEGGDKRALRKSLLALLSDLDDADGGR